MPPLQPAAHILRLRFAGSIQTVSPWNVILHWNYTGPQPPSTTLNALCQQFASAWLTHLAPVHHVGVTLTTVEAVDLTAPDAAFGSALVAHVGTLAGTPFPASVAVCVSWKVNYRWKGGHPRSYFPAGVTASTANGRTWTTAAVGQFETAVNGFFGAMNAAASGSVTGRLTCLRRYQTLEVGQPPVEFTPPLPLDFVTFDVDSRIDTQRRRLGPDVTG